MQKPVFVPLLNGGLGLAAHTGPTTKRETFRPANDMLAIGFLRNALLHGRIP